MSGPPDRPAEELSPLKRALVAIDRLQARVAELEDRRHEPIAIVGIGCRLPGGVDGPDRLWELLVSGTDAVVEVPPDRWDVDALYDPDPEAPGRMASRHGAFLTGVADFDPQAFGISPREAASMDPQQRLLLEVAWEALEHAGIAPDRLAGARAGVFVGMTSGDYATVQLRAAGLSGLDTSYASGVAHSVASGRISYVLGLRGPSVTLDTACSSSLVAVHLAVQSLRTGDADLALAGGVNLMLAPDNSIMLSKLRMLAPDGRCKAFDAAADGFVRGEGCALVVLKRLADAVADGDPVVAVIRGSAVNQDGASSGLTAPNGPAQEAVIRAALADARLAPARVGYVEAHGTGTALGDPIEVQALAASLGAGRAPDDPLRIGSVKTNLGHLEGVAGVAGLIKAALVVERGEIPPHLHLRTPNPHIDWDALPVRVAAGGERWEGEAPRVAGVSAFGFSGTNAHVLLEQPPRADEPAAPAPPFVRPLLLSARTDESLREVAARCAAALSTTDVDDVCRTMAEGRARQPHRAAFVATEGVDLADDLRRFAAGEAAGGARPAHAVLDRADPPRVAMLFTGQGAQHPAMAAGLHRASPVAAGVIERCAAAFDGALPAPLLDVLFAPPDDPRAASLDRTAFTQPALFTVELALAETWRSFGLAPVALLGHSVGEYVAAVVAGVMSLEDAAALLATRARAMDALPAGGAMASVHAAAPDVGELLASACAGRDDIGIAAINGPALTVVSGAATAVAALSAAATARGIEVHALKVSHAFHSPLMDPALAEVAAAASAIAFRSPGIRVVSNVTGEVAGPDLFDAAYWARHVRAPVRFADGVAALARLGVDVVVEAGPHPVLTGMGRTCVPAGSMTWVGSLRRGRDDAAELTRAAGELFAAGVELDWGSVLAHRGRRTHAPTTPFRRERHWVRARRPGGRADDGSGGGVGHPLLGTPVRSPLAERSFAAQVSCPGVAVIDDHRVGEVLIAPAAALIDAALVAASGGTPTAPSSVDDVLVLEALVVPDDGSPVEVHTVVAGGRVRIFSDPGDGTRWHEHASAALAHPGGGEPPIGVDVASVLRRCGHPVALDDHRALLASRGIHLGPSLQGATEIHLGDGEAIGRLALPGGLRHEAVRHAVHPALLDAAIQVVAPLVADVGDAGTTYLPVAVDRVVVWRGGATDGWVHVRVHERRPGDRTVAVDVVVVDEAGGPLVELRGLRLAAADLAVLSAPARRRLASWLHAVEWRPAAAAGPAAADERIRSVAEAGASTVERAAAATDLLRHDGMLRELEALSTDLIVDAVRRLGMPSDPGAQFDEAALAVAPAQRRLVAHLLADLAADGIVAAVPGAPAPRWEVRREHRSTATADRWDRLLEQFPDGAGEITLTRRCGTDLAAVLSGAIDPLDVLFPAGSSADAERMYSRSALARFANAVAARAVREAVDTLPRRRDGKVRILEIGAGTGGTTGDVIGALAGEAFDYTYTDVSPLFVARARERFAGVPGMRFATLDIEGDLATQGFGGERYDVVVAANVLHATSVLDDTFARVGELLAPDGVVVMVEMARPQRFISITFGLTEGWWRFADTDVRPDGLLLPAEGWCRYLASRGWRHPAAAAGGPAPSADDGILTAQAVIVAGAPSATDGPGHTAEWYVVGTGTGTLAADLAGELSHRGHAATAVQEGTPGGGLAVALAGRDRADAGGIGVVALLDGTAPLRAALDLCRTVIAHGAPAQVRLVTVGAQPAAGAAPDAAAAAVWGFGSSLGLEHPELGVRCIDLDPVAASVTVSRLADEVLDATPEDRVALRAGGRHVARLVAAAPAAVAEDPVVGLEVDERGSLDRLELRPIDRREPRTGEVELRVRASGVNFKDVLNVLGMYPGDPGPVGGECAGMVVRVGEGVGHLAVGDEVVAVAPGSHRTYVTCAADLVVRRPATLPVDEAAGLLIPHVTALVGLVEVAGLRAGERVLVHAAAGGVGLAAVLLAQRLGAEVVATAGSDPKRELLRRLGVRHVHDSRSLAFVDEVLAATGGEGVDVVLNSLAGDAATASVSLVRPGGRFVEIGKRDLEDSIAAAHRRGIEHHLVDWGETAESDPGRIRALAERVVADAAADTRGRLPVTTFPLAEARAAFRFVAQARHVGKVVLHHPEPASHPDVATLRPDRTYVVTGALRGLGLLTAQHLADRGARHLALLGRSAAGDAARAAVEALEARGVSVAVHQVDVSDRGALAAVLEQVRASGPPIAGVVHSAGVLDDGAVANLTWERCAAVLAPKLDAARHLDALTVTDPVDHFVLYGSVASTFGSPGQANHAAANAALDALAWSRRCRGLPGTSIGWGAWGEVGAAVDRGVDQVAGERGIGLISNADGLATLDLLLAGADPAVAVTPVDWEVLLRRYGGEPPPYFDSIERSPTGVPAAGGRRPDPASGQAVDRRAAVDGAPAERRHAVLLEIVRDETAAVLELPAAQVGDDDPLSDLGLDSLMAVELRNRFSSVLRLTRPLPATLVFDHPNVAAITALVGQEVLGEAASTGSPPGAVEPAAAAEHPAAPSLVASLLDDLEALSDEEIEARLAGRQEP